jgi:hypothetical protein
MTDMVIVYLNEASDICTVTPVMSPRMLVMASPPRMKIEDVPASPGVPPQKCARLVPPDLREMTDDEVMSFAAHVSVPVGRPFAIVPAAAVPATAAEVAQWDAESVGRAAYAAPWIAAAAAIEAALEAERQVAEESAMAANAELRAIWEKESAMAVVNHNGEHEGEPQNDS